VVTAAAAEVASAAAAAVAAGRPCLLERVLHLTQGHG
jgi:hypothetical protein